MSLTTKWERPRFDARFSAFRGGRSRLGPRSCSPTVEPRFSIGACSSWNYRPWGSIPAVLSCRVEPCLIGSSRREPLTSLTHRHGGHRRPTPRVLCAAVMSCGGSRSLTSRSTTCELRSNKRSALFTASYRVLLRFWKRTLSRRATANCSSLYLPSIGLIGKRMSMSWSEVNLIADNVIQACEYIREPLNRFKLDTFA